MKKIVEINEELCVGCGVCVELCPKEILYIEEKTNKCKVTCENLCDKRKGCENVCPTEAIKIKN